MCLQLLCDGEADQATQRPSDQSIWPLWLDAPDLRKIIGSYFLDAVRQTHITSQPARLQTINRYAGIQMPQQGGKAHADTDDRVNAEQRPLRGFADFSQGQDDTQRVTVLAAGAL